MRLLSRIPCAPRRPERSDRAPRRRRPDLESLEGRRLLSGTAAGLAPMPPALMQPPAAIADSPTAAPPQPWTAALTGLRMAVAD